MKFELGEFVRFVDENREGYITKIFDEQMVGVTGDDDFEIPVMVNNLTRVHGKSKNTSSQNNDSFNVKAFEFIENGVFVAVISDPNKGSVVYFHLVNQTSYQLLSTLKTDNKGTYKGEFNGIVNPQSVSKIYSASLPELDIWPNFQLQILYYTTQNKASKKPITFDIKFRAKDFAGSKTLIPILKEQGWLIRIDEPELIIDAEKIKESFFKQAEEKKTVAKPQKEIDLHIEKIELYADNLRNVVAKSRTLPSPFHATGISVGNGKMTLDGNINLIKEIPDMDLTFSLQSIHLKFFSFPFFGS